ncbi:amidohydrolase [Acidobacteriota bacterium]
MKSKFNIIWIFILISLIGLAASCNKPEESHPSADLIMTNGGIYTMDTDRSWAEAIAITEGKIVYVGDNSGAKKFKNKETQMIDLEGKMVLPGFHDSHIHLVSGGIELGQCNLNGLKTQEDIFQTIKDYAAANPNKEWIVGGGWALLLFEDGNPSKEQLDQLVVDRPAFFIAFDGHSAWANSRALEIAGITKDTSSPKDGRIERHPGTGEPSGTLRESAMEMVGKHIPELSPEEYQKGLNNALKIANGFGITSILEASADEQILETYAALDRRNELTLRVLASIFVDPQKGTDQIKDVIEKRDTYKSKYLKATTAKIFADGVIESHTATLIEPYLDRPGYHGIPNVEPELLNQLAIELDRAGFQVHIHAIGDWAIRMSLDALELAQETNGVRDARHHLAHLELINPDDIPRFKQLGVVANFQPLWAYPDEYITELTVPKLGPERSRWLYPIASIVNTGATIVGGSDWSVSSMNPLDAIQVAVTRRGLEAGDGPAWIPNEVIDLHTALEAYTINGAYVCQQENNAGSLEVGKAADLIVLDQNLFEIPKSDIHKTKVLLTLLEGKEVYRDPVI